jgi:Protein of unknown function (DUF3592)
MGECPESLRSSCLAEPPRRVPLLVRLQLLFGGAINQFGWVFFGFGMVFFWLFVCRADLTSWYRFRGRLETVQGRVTESSDTGASEGGSKHHRGTPIYRNKFTILVDDKEYQGASYATGRELRTGSVVTLEYPPGKPNVARIRGMRTNVFGPAVLFVVIFPLVGLGILSYGLVSGVKACSLLACGIQTSGKLMLKEPTNMRVNRQTVYKFTFTFKTSEGEICTANTKTATERFANDAEERVIYDPRQPRRVLLLANLSGAPQIGEDGHIVAGRLGPALCSSILPLATILGHGWWALRILGL